MRTGRVLKLEEGVSDPGKDGWSKGEAAPQYWYIPASEVPGTVQPKRAGTQIEVGKIDMTFSCETNTVCFTV